MKYRKSCEGRFLRGMMNVLDEIATKLLELPDTTCFSKHLGKFLNLNVGLVKNL
jgi:hypothetical protein